MTTAVATTDTMEEILQSGVRVEISFDPRKGKYVVEFHRPDAEPDRAPFRYVGYSPRPGGYQASVNEAAEAYEDYRLHGPMPVRWRI
jgi:hypothetical protein